jgi:hypothetical protein
MSYYRIYAKFKNDNRFYPVDWNEGRQVKNLIYATLIDDNYLAQAKESLAAASRMNDNLMLEIRNTSNKVVYKTY